MSQNFPEEGYKLKLERFIKRRERRNRWEGKETGLYREPVAHSLWRNDNDNESLGQDGIQRGAKW